MAKKEQLKCFIISYNLTNEAKNAMHSVFVVAYTKKEAGDLFIKWTIGKKIYSLIGGIVTQKAKVTNANKHMITNDYYAKQNEEVNFLFNGTYERVK